MGGVALAARVPDTDAGRRDMGGAGAGGRGAGLGQGELAGGPEVDHVREAGDEPGEGGEDQGVQGGDEAGLGGGRDGIRAQFRCESFDVPGQGRGGIC